MANRQPCRHLAAVRRTRITGRNIAECDEVIGRAGQRVPEERRHELIARYLAQHLRCSGESIGIKTVC